MQFEEKNNDKYNTYKITYWIIFKISNTNV